ncbi:MAG: acyl-CoA/acyl-ACP dehydrogenase [Acidovorax sp.]|nr:acyl-CoA/acyl-ACP dehydrogenase [Acidovorax sp.]
MDFALNDEQQMLQASARRFFADHHPLARARQALPWSDARQRRLWADMAGMGWLALLVPEAHGGLGLGMAEACVVAEEAGRQLVNLPLAASAVLLPQWLAACDDAMLHGWVQAAMAGERAFHCVAEGDAWIDHAGQASDCIAVQGWHDGAVPLRVALRPAAEGVASAFDPTLLQASATAPTAPLEWHTLDVAPEARERARAAHRLALAAELVGVAQAALDLACAYARERVQFGKPIGSYQALKHQLANAWMGVDNARLALLYAAAAIDSGLPDWRFACAAAEYTAIEGAQHSTRTAIQVHGGMGFTWEHDAHLYLKRAQHLAARLGGASRALDHVEALALA